MSRRLEELQEAIQAWDWLEQNPDAPLLLRLATAIYLMFLATGVDSPAALLQSPHLRSVYTGIVRGDLEPFRTWWAGVCEPLRIAACSAAHARPFA
ncbi:MAG: hypothetical protein N2554_01140 [Fimbriimonadales bacterium]|nr:hypothetical protein [Fimbriimonadales bacterium]